MILTGLVYVFVVFSDFKRATYKQVYLAYVGSYYLHHHHHYNQMNLFLIKKYKL